ncbi:MAG: ABC transporter ATP-binding protein [Burkholderiaceae bacterium]
MADDPIVAAQGLRHRYRGVLALDDVSITIAPGSFTAVLGPNGAGKSTLALVLGGLLAPSEGSIRWSRTPARARSLVPHGICLVPEGRRLFGDLSIAENLVVAGYGAGLRGQALRVRVAQVAQTLPAPLLESMHTRLAMSLSGGERQLVALSRALMPDPRLVILDEPSMGLAPLMVDKVYDTLSELQSRGVAVVVIEQIATHAVEHADQLFLLSRGRVVYSGKPTEQTVADAIKASYVGAAA